MQLDIEKLIKELTLEEKAGLCSGEDFWRTKAVERLGLPSVMVSDGPSGLRKQAEASDHLGLKGSVEAVCFPTGSALASSFDKNLLFVLGDHLGVAARAENLHTILGPAVNMKRGPLCGRNFEYFSEDPYLAGELAVGYINGVQSHNVGVSVKHFAANNQESNRMSSDSIVSERALREIYLPAFEMAAKEGHAWSYMCAYNKINGVYCCENEWLLKKVLREEWGSDALVMTDWGAMNDRIESTKKGLDLEMPTSCGIRDRLVVKAVKEGRLTMEELDERVRVVLNWINKGLLPDANPKVCDLDEQHDFAVSAAEECAVLLKNDEELLPLHKGDRILFAGTFASSVRYQGGGSSHVNPHVVSNVLQSLPKDADVQYVPCWADDGETSDEERRKEALDAARAADTVVVFAGLPDSYESEGFDRHHMHLPPVQNEMIEALSAVNPNLAVVLFNGSPVEMPWLGRAKSVLEMNLAGEGVGEATAALVFGEKNPCGHLAETYPLRLEDNPSYLFFPGYDKKVTYAEDIYIGYRWYDKRRMEVLFPFGHGLSYTSFAVTALSVEKTGKQEGKVVAKVKNIGKREGKSVLQLYVAPPKGKVDRPLKELKGFFKVALEPGEEKEVVFPLDPRTFSYYDTKLSSWYAEKGEYQILLGFSSRDIVAEDKVFVDSDPKPFHYEDGTTIGDVVEAGMTEKISEEMDLLYGFFGVGSGDNALTNKEACLAMCAEMPLHTIMSFVPFKDETLDNMKKKLS